MDGCFAVHMFNKLVHAHASVPKYSRYDCVIWCTLDSLNITIWKYQKLVYSMFDKLDVLN